MTSLVDEYRRQRRWRDWQTAIGRCPVAPGQRVLDLGCGPGDVTQLLAERRSHVVGVDNNAELVDAARVSYPHCEFVLQDLRDLRLPVGTFDGLWCGFAAAYFVDFESVFKRWCAALKQRAWVCVVEVDDLLGHSPLTATTRQRIDSFYASALADGRYDFRAGATLPSVLERAGFRVEVGELADQELAYQGPASADVLQAWSARLLRMKTLQRFFGADFEAFKAEFIACLMSASHRSQCRVVCCVGTRG